MGSTRTLGEAGNQVEVTWDLDERTTIPSGTKVWTLRIRICNRTNRNLDIAVAENPWRAPNNTEKVQYDKDANGREVPDSDKRYARAGAKALQLAPGECKTVEFTYDVQPGQAYTDIFERNPNGSLPVNWTWGTVERLTPVQVSSVPREQKRTFAVAMSTPLQMFAAEQHDGPVKAVIERVDVPDGFELAHTFPGICVPFVLERGDRGSQAAVLLRQLDGLPEGARATVTTWQRILEPAALAEQQARPVNVDLVNDRTDPKVDISRIHVGMSAVSLTLTAVDLVSGVDRVEGLVMHDDGTLCSVQPRSDVSSGGGAVRELEMSIPVARGAMPPRLVVRATDLVGNSTVHPLPAISADPCEQGK